jgi:hypothetical protein
MCSSNSLVAGKMVFRRREGTGCGLNSNCVCACVLTRVRECVCVLVFVEVCVCPEDTISYMPPCILEHTGCRFSARDVFLF